MTFMQWHFHFILGVHESVVFNSYIMGKSGLLDVYTRSLRAADPRAEGVYIIYQRTTSVHDITAM